MKKAISAILLVAIEMHALAQNASAEKTQVVVNSQGPRLNRILRAETSWAEAPKIQEDWPGSHTLALTNKLPDLELRLWDIGGKFLLEFVLNTTKVNQEILNDPQFVAVNDPGDGTGFFWAQIEGKSKTAIDMACISKKNQCIGKWESFPFEEGKKQKVIVNSSMRGFAKRQWTIELEAGLHQKIPAGSMPRSTLWKNAHGTDPGGEVSETVLYDKEVYKNPFSELQYAPIRIDLWQVKKRPSDAGIGFHKQQRIVLYEVTDGVAKLDLLTGKQYSTYEVRKGERVWTPAGAGVSIRASGGKGEDSAVIRRVEFP